MLMATVAVVGAGTALGEGASGPGPVHRIGGKQQRATAVNRRNPSRENPN